MFDPISFSGRQMDIPCPVTSGGNKALSCVWKHQLPATGNVSRIIMY